MYQITHILKIAEQDDFEQGCIGDSQDSDISIRLTDTTIDGLVTRFAEFCGCKAEDVERNVCDEIGRIECQRTENGEGYEPTETELQQWREGKSTVYVATYTAFIYECKLVAA